MSLGRFTNFLSAAIVTAAALLGASTLHAQAPHDTSADWAKANLAKSPRHGEYVTIAEPGGRKLQAWVVYPEIKDKAPVVVMIHEIFGLSDWAREMADELAGAGYIVVEPDLLSGYGPATAKSSLPEPANPIQAVMHHCDPMACPQDEDAKPRFKLVSSYDPQQQDPHDHVMRLGTSGQDLIQGSGLVRVSPGGTDAFPDQGAVVKAVSSLPDIGVIADLDEAADYGKHLPASNGKVFVAGFCWGGGKTFLFATHRRDLSGAFVFYGPPPPAEAMKTISAPVYGFYAGNDARITATIPQTTADMKAAGKTYEPVTYDGAGHGFMRAGEAPDASAANSAARAAGFRRLVSLLGGVL